VDSECKIPIDDLAFLSVSIQTNVNTVLTGDEKAADAYKITVVITEYDKGNAFARFMLIGLGQMDLHGSVTVSETGNAVVVRDGEFKKNYCVGGIMGGSATMRKDVLPQVGIAIAMALKESPPAAEGETAPKDASGASPEK
jgi:hypothetical protein